MDPKVQEQLLKQSDVLATKLQALVSSHAPKVWDATLDTIRVEGYVTLIPAFIEFVFGLVFLFLIYKIFSYYRTDEDFEAKNFFAAIITITLGCFSFVSIYFGLTCLLNGWNYIEIFAPQLYLIHLVLSKVTG